VAHAASVCEWTGPITSFNNQQEVEEGWLFPKGWDVFYWDCNGSFTGYEGYSAKWCHPDCEYLGHYYLWIGYLPWYLYYPGYGWYPV
jgi:hypothetical protein